MLVLSRKVGEKIIIGDNIEVTVVSTHGNKVKLGIDAPTSIPVHREEIVGQCPRRETPATSAAH